MGRWCPPCNAAQTSVALSFTRYLLAFCQVCLLKLAATLIDIGNPTQIELNPGGMDSLPLHQWLHYSLIRVIKNFSAAALSFLFSGVSQQRKLIGYARMLHEGRSRGTCARPRERRSFFFQFLFLQTGIDGAHSLLWQRRVHVVVWNWMGLRNLLGPWAPLSSCTTVFVKSNKIKRSNSKKKKDPIFSLN